MFQTKVVEKIKTHILCSITLFRKSCLLWDNVKKYGTVRQATDDNIIRRMRFACWITKATYVHSEYAILIAFRRQQWLRECASVLRLYYSACLICCLKVIALWRVNSFTYQMGFIKPVWVKEVRWCLPSVLMPTVDSLFTKSKSASHDICTQPTASHDICTQPTASHDICTQPTASHDICTQAAVNRHVALRWCGSTLGNFRLRHVGVEV
jgi:hypothetical protein